MADAQITLRGRMPLAALRGLVSEMAWLLRRHGALELGQCGERVLLAPHGEIRIRAVADDAGDRAAFRIELEWVKNPETGEHPEAGIDLMRLLGCAPSRR